MTNCQNVGIRREIYDYYDRTYFRYWITSNEFSNVSVSTERVLVLELMFITPASASSSNRTSS